MGSDNRALPVAAQGSRRVGKATALGFASYCLTLASLPAYAVAGGAAQTTAGAVTTVFLLVTIVVQMAVPVLTARFGIGPVLAAGLLAATGLVVLATLWLLNVFSLVAGWVGLEAWTWLQSPLFG